MQVCHTAIMVKDTLRVCCTSPRESRQCHWGRGLGRHGDLPCFLHLSPKRMQPVWHCLNIVMRFSTCFHCDLCRRSVDAGWLPHCDGTAVVFHEAMVFAAFITGLSRRQSSCQCYGASSARPTTVDGGVPEFSCRVAFLYMYTHITISISSDKVITASKELSAPLSGNRSRRLKGVWGPQLCALQRSSSSEAQQWTSAAGLGEPGECWASVGWVGMCAREMPWAGMRFAC